MGNNFGTGFGFRDIIGDAGTKVERPRGTSTNFHMNVDPKRPLLRVCTIPEISYFGGGFYPWKGWVYSNATFNLKNGVWGFKPFIRHQNRRNRRWSIFHLNLARVPP